MKYYVKSKWNGPDERIQMKCPRCGFDGVWSTLLADNSEGPQFDRNDCVCSKCNHRGKGWEFYGFKEYGKEEKR